MAKTEYLGELELITVRDEKGRVYTGRRIEMIEAAIDAVATLDEMDAQIDALLAVAK